MTPSTHARNRSVNITTTSRNNRGSADAFRHDSPLGKESPRTHSYSPRSLMAGLRVFDTAQTRPASDDDPHATTLALPPTPFAPAAAAPGPSPLLGRTTKPTSPRFHIRITRTSSATRSRSCAPAASPVAAALTRCPSSRRWSWTSDRMAKSAYSTRAAT